MFVARFQPLAHRLPVEFLRISYNGNNDGCASTLESWLSTKRNVNETQRRGADGRLTQPQLVEETGASQITNVTSDAPEPEQETQSTRTNDLVNQPEEEKGENLRKNNGTSAEDSAQKTETTALAATEAQFHCCSPASFRISCRTALR